MREGATLRLDSGVELRVDVETDDLDSNEIVVRRIARAEEAPLFAHRAMSSPGVDTPRIAQDDLMENTCERAKTA